jgi:hypothetical protein
VQVEVPAQRFGERLETEEGGKGRHEDGRFRVALAECVKKSTDVAAKYGA